jgi:membrane-associated phospholipid phosphatase
LKRNINLQGIQVVGIVGTIAALIIYVRQPSWPTPDKIVIFLTFVAMIFGQTKELLKRFVPFVALLLVYESFRSVVPKINHYVNYSWMPSVDRALLGGELPTKTLQNWLWHGYVQWYDFLFYLAYMLHFIIPLGLAVLVWQKRDEWYWRVVSSYVMLSFLGFLTYLAFPAAPPWLASDKGIIEPIHRISSDVWYALGVKDFPSFYNRLSPNPVAAVPSLHAAYASLCSIWVWKLFGKKLGLTSLIYPALIYTGTVYQGEHYIIDAILGTLYALAAYFVVLKLYQKWHQRKKA